MSSRRVIIALKGLGALANHGVYDFERTQEQRFSADVVMWIETAGTTDDIAATVSYADIADETMAVLTGNPVDLIETLAETIASRVMSHEGVVGTEVTVHKPDAPINHPFADVSVTVRRGETDAMPLSLSLKGIYEAEDGSVLTGEIEAYGRAQAPSPAQQKKAAPTRKRRGEHAAPARPEDISRPAHLRARRVVLAIGGNLGDVPVTLMHTVEALSYMEGFQIEDVSPIMRTKPVLAPGQAPQPDYWNAVVVGSAIATPDELFAQTSRIERELGRERHERWGARSIDIDIIQVEGLASSDPVLTLPHPRAKERAFVLAPWLLCDPNAVLEGVGRVCDLLATTPDREGIIDAVDDWLEDPSAVIADSDQLIAQRNAQANADMRELLETLTGEISHLGDLSAPIGEPPAAPSTVVEGSVVDGSIVKPTHATKQPRPRRRAQTTPNQTRPRLTPTSRPPCAANTRSRARGRTRGVAWTPPTPPHPARRSRTALTPRHPWARTLWARTPWARTPSRPSPSPTHPPSSPPAQLMRPPVRTTRTMRVSPLACATRSAHATNPARGRAPTPRTPRPLPGTTRPPSLATPSPPPPTAGTRRRPRPRPGPRGTPCPPCPRTPRPDG